MEPALTDNFNQLVEECVEMNKSGKGFTEIRKVLEARKLDSDYITDVIRETDNRILRGEKSNSLKLRSRELRIIGLVIMIGGGAITSLTYLGLIDLNGYYVLAWGPIIGGYLMILAARRMNRNSR